MIGFAARFLVLIVASTLTALIVVLLASGIVNIGVDGSWESGVIPTLILFGGSILITGWYEATERKETPA